MPAKRYRNGSRQFHAFIIFIYLLSSMSMCTEAFDCFCCASTFATIHRSTSHSTNMKPKKKIGERKKCCVATSSHLCSTHQWIHIACDRFTVSHYCVFIFNLCVASNNHLLAFAIHPHIHSATDTITCVSPTDKQTKTKTGKREKQTWKRMDRVRQSKFDAHAHVWVLCLRVVRHNNNNNNKRLIMTKRKHLAFG